MNGPASTVGRWLWNLMNSPGRPFSEARTDLSPEELRSGQALGMLGLAAAMAAPFAIWPFLILLSLMVLARGISKAAFRWLTAVVLSFVLSPYYPGKLTAFFSAVLPVAAGSAAGIFWARRPQRCLFLLFLLGFAFGCVALAQWRTAAPVPASWLSGAERRILPTRVTGIYGNPNLFAGILLFVLPAGGMSVFFLRSAKLRRGFFLFFGLQLLAFFLTFSFGAWIALLVETVVFLGLRKGISDRRGFIAAGLALAVILVLIFAHLGETAGYRWRIWRTAWRVFVNRPWGTGPGGFKHFNFEVPGTVQPDHAHHLFLQILDEEGFLGGLAFFGVVVSLLDKGVRVRKGWESAILAALWGQMAFGLTDFAWATPLQLGLFWLGEGMLYATTSI